MECHTRSGWRSTGEVAPGQGLEAVGSSATHNPDRTTRPTPPMPTVLALHLGGSTVHAAVASRGRIDLLALDDQNVYLPAPAPTDGPGLVRVLATAQARCLRVVDAVPDELVVVRPAGGVDDALLGEAARRARVPVPVVLEELRAVAALAAHGPAGVDPMLAPALGGIFWHRRGDAPTGPKPIVTREDLGVDAGRPERLPPAPSVVAVGPRTVFEEEAGTVRQRRMLPLPLLGVLVVVVLGVLTVLLVLPDDDRAIAPPPEPFPATTVPATTVPVITTVAPATALVSTTVPSTTIAVPTTAPTTTVTPPTSAEPLLAVDPVTGETFPPAPVPTEVPATEEQPDEGEEGTPATTTSPPQLGTVTLSGVGLTADATTDDERLLALGDDGALVLADLVTVLGEPVGDTGWATDGLCTPAEVRRLVWGDLEVVLARDAVEWPSRMAQWFVSGEDDASVSSLWTLERIGVGSTVADLRAAHGTSLSLEQPLDRDPAGWFDTEPVLGDGILGAVGNTTDTGRVLLMWAGNACQRRLG